MSMTGVISGVVTRKDKTKLNPLLAKKKSYIFKIFGKLLFFPTAIKKRELASKHGSKMIRCDKSAS